eukprot:Pgem_evm1s4505
MTTLQETCKQENRKDLYNHLIQSTLKQFNLDTERQQLANCWPLTNHTELCFALYFVIIV